MSTGYQIYDQSGCYFLTFQVVQWADVFSRKIYRDIIIESPKYGVQHKRLRLHAWTHENHAVELHSAKFIKQKMDYIHQNPIRAGIVEKEEDYLYSSAKEYFTGKKGLVALEKRKHIFFIADLSYFS